MASLFFLTPHEMEILLLLLREKDNHANAEEVVVSEKLVDCYLDYVQTMEGTHMHEKPEMHVPGQKRWVDTFD